MSETNAAADRVKIVIVGLNFGVHIIREITQGAGKDYLEVVGVCDLDAAKAQEQALALGVREYASLNDVLKDDTVEAVGLFSTPGGRAYLLEKIIRAGKHVLTTKPFELNADAALSVLREAQKLGKVIALNSPSSTLPPDLALVDKWRVEYDLGRAIGGRFDVWASYNETADGRWYDDPDLCPIAPVFRIGIYLINDAVRLFGEAAEVSALWSTIRTRRPTPDNAQLGIRFHSGALANIFASFCVDDGDTHRNQMTVNFERGTVYRNCGPVQNAYRAGGSEMALVRHGAEGREIAADKILPGYHPQFAYQWDVFYKLVRGDRSIETVKPEIVAAGVRIIEALSQAQKSGGRAMVDRVLQD